MGLSRAEKHNRMMDKVYGEYHANLKNPSIKSFKRHQVKIGVASKDKGLHHPGSKGEAIKRMKK